MNKKMKEICKKNGIDPKDPRIKYFYVTGKDGQPVKVSNVVKGSDGTSHILNIGTR